MGLSGLVARLLGHRGVHTRDQADAFLRPSLAHLHDPQQLGGAEPAAQRIAQAVREGERIAIYGDYDVDGIAASAILHACLKMVGAEAELYVPHRLDEGYGLNHQAVETLVAGGTQLLVTVDCGISAIDEVAGARSAGVDVIVTDHHALGPALPDAHHIVHPALPSADYPNEHLCGAGVALKLAWQVARELCGNHRVDEPMREFLLDATCLAALATIADVVPLLGENRALAYHGLRGLSASKHPGLRALLASAKLTGEALDAFHVGFVLAPRLNACGRMGHAQLAVELLTTAEGDRAAEIAAYLDKQNTQRQRVEREIADQAIARVERQGLDGPDTRMIVLAGDDWHGGVIGIVASRLVDRFHKPAILICPSEDGLGRGSGRSVPQLHMRDAMQAASEHLEGFGGHAMAGGLTIRMDRVEAFAEAINAYATEHLADAPEADELEIEAEADLSELTYRTVEQIRQLGPFGAGNPAPVIAVRNCRLVSPPRRMGRRGNTVGLQIGGNGGTIKAVGFRMGDLADRLVGVNTVDIAGEPMLNTYNGRTSVQLKLVDVQW
jgi:single-stranded-DNA-specific exonuclease